MATNNIKLFSKVLNGPGVSYEGVSIVFLLSIRSCDISEKNRKSWFLHHERQK